MNDDYDLISLDVVFTNIPINFALDSVTSRWEQIRKGTKIPLPEFINALRKVLDSTFFSFNNKIYKQKFGTPMGSPVLSIIANIIMEDVEKKALNNLIFEMPIYYRYVDDIAVPCDKSKEVLDLFNSVHSWLQLTLEIGGLNFLDVTIINNNNVLQFNYYTKLIFSSRFLSYLSQHPISQKRDVLMSVIDRIFLLSHPRFYQKNFDFIIMTFLDNGYPMNFIFKTISIRLRNLFNKKTRKQNVDNTNDVEFKR